MKQAIDILDVLYWDVLQFSQKMVVTDTKFPGILCLFGFLLKLTNYASNTFLFQLICLSGDMPNFLQFREIDFVQVLYLSVNCHQDFKQKSVIYKRYM